MKRINASNQKNPLFCFHGLFGIPENWDIFLQQMSKKGFQGQAEDLYNFDSFYDFESFANYFKKKLDNLGIKKIHLIGYSMGGRIATYFASHFPSYIDSLVLESSSFGIMNQKEKEIRYQNDKELLAEVSNHQELERFLEQWYNNPLFYQIKKNEKFQDYLKNTVIKLDVTKLKKAINGFSVGNQEYLLDKIIKQDFPVLYIYGEKDEKYKELATGISSSIRVREIKNSGHNTHFENSKDFFCAVSEFFEWIN